MSTTIDQRVVEMRFDNRNFENNVQTSISTLDRLKQSLNLTGASKGLENINTAANKVNMSGMSSAIENIGLRFNAMYSIADQTFRNITNSAYYAGKRMLSALTIDPIKTGFQEYETQINAVQTILANTESKGTTMSDVNKALDELNTYADKTIYNFTEMTRNIGTFTAAGVDLDTSVSAIQGIANLAAVSGSNSQQASTAMYQLSQALANGKVNLQDWNSVVNAGMGGEVFQNALKRTAKNMGTDVDALVKKYGSFRESLTKGEWLTTDVLTKTLEQFTMSAEKGSKEWDKFKKSLMDDGYTEKQAEEILEMANTATDAATKVKTFTQLFDTLKEAAQSGWTQTWEIIVGDFEEAKALLTNISDVIGGIINKSSEARNNLLQGWKDAGGRNDLIDGLWNMFDGVAAIITPIKEAFSDIFPPLTVKQLTSFTDGFKKLTSAFETFTDKHGDQIYRTFKGLFSIVDIFRKIITSTAKVIGSFLTGGSVGGLVDLILKITASIGDFFTTLNNGIQMDGIAGFFSELASGISSIIGKAAKGIAGFGDELSAAANWIGDALGTIWKGITKVFGWITDNVSAGDIFAGLAGGGIFIFAKKLSGVFDKIKDTIDKLFGGKGGEKKSLGIGEKFAEILDSVGESIQSFTNGIKVASLVSIAAAIAILSGALKTIAGIKAIDVTKSLLAMGMMFSMLTLSFKAITEALNTFKPVGVVKAGISIMMMAKAIDILAGAMTEISKLSLPQLAKSLIGVGAGIFGLTKGLKAISGVKISISTSISILVLAEACGMLGDAMAKFGSMSWGEIIRGLAGMGGALVVFVTAIQTLGKVSNFKSLLGSGALLIAVDSLDKLAEGLKKFASMSWPKIIKGLAGMGLALAEVAIITGVLGKVAGFSGILGAIALVTVVQALDEIADALKDFGSMSWEEIKRGLAGMGGALVELGVVVGLLGYFTGFSGILGAAALVIAVQSLAKLADAFEQFSFMSWEEIKRGLAGMGGALLELGVVTGLLGRLTGLSGLLGAAALVIAVQSLGKLADALIKFGSMTWDEIGRGLAGMGGALVELGVVSGLLGKLAPFGGLVGSGALAISMQGIGKLADALIKFGSMEWDEIGKGLAAMGGALGELALGGFLNTFAIIGSYSISEMAEPLGMLADSVKKWKDVTVPDKLGFNLMLLADGVKSFTFAGFGASAIDKSSVGIGILAESVKKWKDVTVPEGMTEKLTSLADGIKSFTWAGWGASSLTESAPGIGAMADSIKKWSNVTVPENIEKHLTGIANGIKSFTWAFVGGWSLSSIVDPLAKLAESISKWKDVTVPDKIGDQLTSIANGLEAFSWLFSAGWTIDSIGAPLGQLADSVKKWKDVTVPEGMGDKLETIADGIGAFKWLFTGGYNLGTVAEPLGKLADSVKKWKDVTVPEKLGDSLKSISEAIKAFSGIGDISASVSSFKEISNASVKLSNIKFETITGGLKSLSDSLSAFASSSKSISGVGETITKNIIDPLKSASSKLKDTGADIIKSLGDGITSNSEAVTTSINTIIDAMNTTISDRKSELKNTGKKLSSELASGIKNDDGKTKKAVKSVVKTTISTIKDYYDDFSSAGSHLVDGFASGISENSYKAEAKATAMAEAAKLAAEKALGIASPSKVFKRIGGYVADGFAVGVDESSSAVDNSVTSMATGAINGAKSAMARITDAINSDIHTQPTIRPVLDLSDIQSGAGTINGLFGMQPTIGLASNISSSMKRRSQNGANSDVVSAIDKLSKRLDNIGNTTYSVNGVNFGGDAEVEEAFRVIANAITVGGRA